MHPVLLRTRARIRDAIKPLGEAAVGALTIGLLRTTRYFDPAVLGMRRVMFPDVIEMGEFGTEAAEIVPDAGENTLDLFG